MHGPAKADLNLYAYVKGAVLQLRDPLGLDWSWEGAKKAIAAKYSGAKASVSNAKAKVSNAAERAGMAIYGSDLAQGTSKAVDTAINTVVDRAKVVASKAGPETNIPIVGTAILAVKVSAHDVKEIAKNPVASAKAIVTKNPVGEMVQGVAAAIRGDGKALRRDLEPGARVWGAMGGWLTVTSITQRAELEPV